MKTLTTLVSLSVAVLLFAQPAHADKKDAVSCKRVRGHATWTLIPAPNDPFGRIVGPSRGTLKAAISAIITSLTELPGGALAAKSLEVWVLGAQDILIADGEATFTPIPGQPIGTVHDELTLTITGGTGAFSDATGTIQVTGVGHNIFGPDSGPGSGFFEVTYDGKVCVPKDSDAFRGCGCFDSDDGKLD